MAKSKCPHEVFNAQVTVNRIEDAGRFMADVSIRCDQCGVPFKFLGLPLGLDYNSACVDFAGQEARLAIAPIDEAVPPIHGVEGFSIRKVAADGEE